MLVCFGGLNAKIVQIGFILLTLNIFYFAYFQEKSAHPIDSQCFLSIRPENIKNLGSFSTGIHSMQGSTATTRYSVTRKRSTKRLKHI